MFIIQADEELYPEAYRKSEYIKGSNDQVPETLRIAKIEEIFVKDSGSKLPNLDEIKIRVKKFYRYCVSYKILNLLRKPLLNQRLENIDGQTLHEIWTQ